MAQDAQFKFDRKVASSGFSQALSQKVDGYFQTRRISKRANLEMIFKTILAFLLWIGTYLWLMTGRFSPLDVVAIYVLHGYAQLYMGLNIAHDANHGAYARSKRINRALGCVFDLVGLSSYMWQLMHNDAHHVFVNVRGADTALVSGSIFRFSPHDRRRPFHRYQHLYAPFFYCLSTLDWVLTKDYRWLFSAHRFGNRKVAEHPLHELFILFAGKAFYYTYTLVLPLLYLKAPWYSVVLGFIVMHFFLGFTLALTFQPNHFTEDSSFPEPDERGHISNNYIKHIFDTTADYARGNPLACWFLGGLNLHVIHHMFPGICHVHYPALTEIVKSTAAEYGLTYRESRTVTGAFLAHLKWMKILGNTDGDPTSAIGLGRGSADGSAAAAS
ncbi:MAG TPA: acyl-CoA desaturase [Bryobacteraceae bacterium]|jgi:linoleoyl-CoA desaturase|nr:acyl-CoA desaturase [Bryobacteraceae bacterium]